MRSCSLAGAAQTIPLVPYSTEICDLGLRAESSGRLAESRLLRAQDLERYSARRAAGRAAYQVRAGNQRPGYRPKGTSHPLEALRALLLELRFSPGSRLRGCREGNQRDFESASLRVPLYTGETPPRFMATTVVYARVIKQKQYSSKVVVVPLTTRCSLSTMWL